MERRNDERRALSKRSDEIAKIYVRLAERKMVLERRKKKDPAVAY